ncbi:serine hydrolase domain-containing protein [Salinarimonas sp.]|uniref:serine hydrolase domain-containing protein n=1 Tax=Salinarimonas sp. TaxID=2766526 RepID=UPI0032D99784
MKPAPALLVVALLCAGCATLPVAAPEACRDGQVYAGAPLRPALPPGTLPLRDPGRARLAADEAARLERAFDDAFARTNAVSMTAAVWRGGDAPWSATRGASPGALHAWASVGKMVTAAAILRLAEADRLSLTDPIAAHVDDVPNGDAVTIDMLLEHTAGLARDAPGDRPPAAIACPGTVWRYSNAGYVLLGRVIESVTGRPYHEAAAALVLARSAAVDIRLLAPDDDQADVAPLAPQEALQNSAQREEPRDARAAGSLAADAASMALLLRDLLSGRVLPAETVRAQFARLYPMNDDGFWYGRGVIVFDVPGNGGTTPWLGHAGGFAGAKAIVAYVPDQDAIVAVALTGDGSAAAAANLLLGAIGA